MSNNFKIDATIHRRLAIALVTVMCCFNAFAEQANAVAPASALGTKQNLSAIKSKITEFLETQAIGYPGKVSVHAGSIDPNMKLAQCTEMQVFLPTGSRAWGKTSVGVRCNAPSIWTIYVQATVNVIAQ